MHPSQHAVTQPDKAAIIMAKTGERVTYRELDQRSNQGAWLMQAGRLKPGDAIGIFMHNSPRYMEIMWSAQRSGLFYVGIPTRLKANELLFILQDAVVRVLFYSADLTNIVQEAAREMPELQIFEVDGTPGATQSFEAARANFPVTPIENQSAGQDLLYSSGTTGWPKGISLPKRDVAFDVDMPVTTLVQNLYGFDSNTVYLNPAPLYHSAPLRFTAAVEQLGGTTVIMERFDPEAALELIEKYRVTHAQWVPTHFVRILKLPTEIREKYDMSSLKCAVHAAAPCPIEIKERMIDWWGSIVHEYYSSTELHGFTNVTAEEWLTHRGTVGRAIIGKIRICDDDGNPLPPQREGLIYFEDGNPIKYRNDPKKTQEAHNQYGWATVGDIGRVDEEGFLYLTDRQSFMIISGGVNIYPQEIENLLITHPKVADAAVIGAPDEDMGERVVAVVQPANWIDAGEALAQELTAFLQTRMSGVKIPRQIDFEAELPRQPTGKLFKRLIREKYWQSKPPLAVK
jgi:long-chain acyl-CoA synthetase